jgi:competence CoiA-like predicted nuclease
MQKSSQQQYPIFYRASPKLPTAAQLAYLMEYISSNTIETNQNLRDQKQQQNNYFYFNTPQETKTLQKQQEIQNTSENPPVLSLSSPPPSASNHFINSLTIRKKTLPYKSRFKSAPNMQKFDFRQVHSNYQLRIINKKVLVSARMRTSRKIRKFNFVLPETCDTRTFTHRLDRGVLEFKWKTIKKETN